MRRINMERLLTNKYNHLLVVLILIFILSPFVSDGLRIFNVSLMAVLFLGATLIALRAVIEKARVYHFWFCIACLTLLLDAIGNSVFAKNWNLDKACRFAAFFMFVGFLGFTVVVLLKKLFIVKRVDVDTIKGGICVYLLLGMIWAFFYESIALFDPQAFNVENPTFFYFSYTTLTTVGYGDIVPVHPVARTLSNLEGITGQVYLAVFVARLVGLYIVQEMSEKGE